jgi:hypothetical protein
VIWLQNVKNSEVSCAQQVENSVVAHQADKGPFGHTQQQTTNHKNHNANQIRTTIVPSGLSFITADCCLLASLFSDLVENDPTPWAWWPWRRQLCD